MCRITCIYIYTFFFFLNKINKMKIPICTPIYCVFWGLVSIFRRDGCKIGKYLEHYEQIQAETCLGFGGFA